MSRVLSLDLRAELVQLGTSLVNQAQLGEPQKSDRNETSDFDEFL